MAKNGLAKIETTKRPSWAKKLDDREFRFVSEYLIDLHRTKAVLRARITEKYDYARTLAAELMARASVVEAIDIALSENAPGPRQWILGRLALIARGDMSDFVDWETDDVGVLRVHVKDSRDIAPELRQLIKRIVHQKDGTLKIELHDPVRAIELLSKVSSIALLRDSDAAAGGLKLETLVIESMILNV